MSLRLSDVECSAMPRSVFAIVSALGMCHSSTRPSNIQVRHLHMISSTRPSFALVLQVTDARMRRPGYEARGGIGPVNPVHMVFSDNKSFLLRFC